MYNRAKQSVDMNYLDVSKPHKISIASYNYYPEESLHPDRIMTEHDIFIVIDGEWEVYQNDVAYPLKKGDAVFLFAGQHHYGLSKCTKETKTIFIHIEPNERDAFARSPQNTENTVAFPVKLSCKKNPEIVRYFDKLAFLYSSTVGNKQILMNAYSDLLLLALADLGDDKTSDNGNVISDILNTINTDLSRFYSIDELADKYYICKRKLIYLFKTYTGYPPHQYQINMKLDLCNDILKNENNTTFRDLAERFGFYDEFHFSKLYKARFGHAPKFTRK